MGGEIQWTYRQNCRTYSTNDMLMVAFLSSPSHRENDNLWHCCRRHTLVYKGSENQAKQPRVYSVNYPFPFHPTVLTYRTHFTSSKMVNQAQTNTSSQVHSDIRLYCLYLKSAGGISIPAIRLINCLCIIFPSTNILITGSALSVYFGFYCALGLLHYQLKFIVLICSSNMALCTEQRS